MEVRREETVIVTIIMTEDEALWLKNTMQNPLNGESVETENERDRIMRKMFWHTIDEEGI